MKPRNQCVEIVFCVIVYNMKVTEEVYCIIIFIIQVIGISNLLGIRVKPPSDQITSLQPPPPL